MKKVFNLHRSDGLGVSQAAIAGEKNYGAARLIFILLPLLIACFTFTTESALPADLEYQFSLRGNVYLDGVQYFPTGFERCRYGELQASPKSDPFRMGGPVLDGRKISTERDAPSVITTDGRGALILVHGGSCPSLHQLQQSYLSDPGSAYAGLAQAYYFPDRNNPREIWIFSDQRNETDAGRFLSRGYAALTSKDDLRPQLAQNVPIAWKWYEEFSARFRSKMSGSGSLPTQPPDATWRGIFACVVYEDEWQRIADFVRVAAHLSKVSIVDLNQTGENWPRSCVGARTRHISLVPSDDYSKATIDLGRNDLRWATIATPYVAAFRDESSRWTPEICVSDEGCTGFRKKGPVWLYLPHRRLFVRLDEQRLETFRFPNFALRKGDGL